jgi:hypothetical protein
LINKLLLTLLFAAGAVFGETTEPAGSPPAGIDPAVAAVLQKDGIRVKDGDKVVSELWFVASPPSAPKNTEDNVSITNIPHGALMGVIRFPERGSDRRGQQIKPGVYTMRLSFFPPNGDHQGVAPQRDFFLLLNAADDKDPKVNMKFEPLTKLSMKASGTPHPLVLSAWKADSNFKAGIAQEGEHDWVLQTKIGDTPIALIVVGKVDH